MIVANTARMKLSKEPLQSSVNSFFFRKRIPSVVVAISVNCDTIYE